MGSSKARADEMIVTVPLLLLLKMARDKLVAALFLDIEANGETQKN